MKWCREILRNSPTAIRVLKASLNAVDDGHAGLQVPYYCFRCFLLASIFLVNRKHRILKIDRKLEGMPP